MNPANIPGNCELRRRADGALECVNCGWTYRGPHYPKRNCPGAPPLERWPADDLAFILQTLCPACPHYRAGRCYSKCRGGREVARMAAKRGAQCPLWLW